MINELGRHEMELLTMHPDWTQEWYCPLCGHQLVVHLLPRFETHIVLQGDPDARHVGKGDWEIVTNTLEMTPMEDQGLENDQDVKVDLGLWADSLDGIDFDDW